MPLPWSELIGFGAATLTTLSFVPQVWKTFCSRDVSGISLGMYATFTVGVAGWLVYGLLNGAWPIVVANAITLSLSCAVLAMKLRFG
ncbi:SemiSWEET transporter [Ramlibacter sp. AN1015]|uniref:SemiSWEET transporter n=1 Tax=Ramlibacter sp. AN1015 TaxID=3133428 RepID=UPI0030C53CBA